MTIAIDLTGRVALVTGGARGVGRGITDRLLAAGATVAVVRAQRARAGAAARRRRRSWPADVRDADAVDRARRRRGRATTAGSTSP